MEDEYFHIELGKCTEPLQSGSSALHVIRVTMTVATPIFLATATLMTTLVISPL
jgi:hypothetical protein